MTIPANDTFCVLPWIHLYVGPDGNVLPCCSADQQQPFGNIEQDTVDQIRNNSKFQQLRQQMIQGEKHSTCERCYFLESQGHKSERTIQNRVWGNHAQQFDFTSTTTEQTPVYLDIRLSNLCNLKCRMCSGYYSSSIQQEENEIWGIKNKNQVLSKSCRAENMEQILDLLPQVEKLYFAGGEPLMSTEHYQILERLIELGKTDVELAYNTNFTRLELGRWRVLDLWQQFDHVHVMASLDAQGAVAEYVRHGTVWTDVLQNLEHVQQCKSVELHVLSTVGFMTVLDVIDMQKHWHQKYQFDPAHWNVHAMISPEHLTLSILPDHHKQQISRAIQTHSAWCIRQGAENLAQEWHSIERYMLNNTASPEGLSELKRLTRLMDRHRGEKFSTVLPEFAYLLQ